MVQERKEIQIVNDQIFASTWSRMIAEATAQVLTQIYSTLDSHYLLFEKLGGIYNLSSEGSTSWYGFTRAILKLDSNYSKHIYKILKLIPTNEYPTPAHRPA